MRRVVITGMGTINPIGHNVNETWESIKNKECGIQEISLIDSSTYKTKFDAEIKNYDPNEFFVAHSQCEHFYCKSLHRKWVFVVLIRFLITLIYHHHLAQQ